MSEIELPKLPTHDTFINQEDVDQYLIETEEYVDQVKDEKSAIQLYKRIARLKSVAELYFIPDIVYSWQEMALCYIESPAAVFECTHYEQIAEIHQNGFEQLHLLEQHVLHNMLPAEMLFGMIHGFNVDVKEFNKYCKKYHQEPFDYYQCVDDDLKQKYNLWLG